MSASKVYFSDLRTSPSQPTLAQKLHRLMKAAGFEDIAFDGKFTAVKMNFGEPGNLAYLRPNWAKAVCDYVKELGGMPYLADCNTLYVAAAATAWSIWRAPTQTASTPSRPVCTPSSPTASRATTTS